MAGIHFEATLNNSQFISSINEIQQQVSRTAAIVERVGKPIDESFGQAAGLAMRKLAKELGDIKIDLSDPRKELELFDESVLKMCQNLERYFDGLEAKVQSYLSIAQNNQAILVGISPTSDNSALIEEAKRQNSELLAKIQQQREELERERETYRQLADAVRSNNVGAIQLLAQESTRSAREIRKDIKATSGELDKQEAIVEELQEAYRRGVAEEQKWQRILEKRKARIDNNNYGAATSVEAGEAELAKASKNAAKLKEQLEEATGAQESLSQELARYEQELEDAGRKHVRIRTQIMEAREQMGMMISAGQTGTARFQEIATQASKMRKEMALANATLQYFADPNRHLTTLKTGLQGVAGAAGLITGVMGLFNDKSEKMAEIQTKVQSVLAIVVGLETTYNLVKKTSNVMLALEEVRTWALAKARGVQTAATVAATGAQEALNTSMRANPIGAIISLFAILGTAIYATIKAITSETDAEKEAREEKERHAKEIRKMHEDWANSVASSASSQIASYKQLQLQWNNLGNDLKAKKKFIDENQDSFHNLGGAIDSVSDAEKFFVENTDAVVASMMARAKAAAYRELAQEEIKKQIKAEEGANSVRGGKYKTVFHEGQTLSDEQWKRYKKEYGLNNLNGADIDTMFKGFMGASNTLTQYGADRLNRLSSQYAAQQREKEKTRRDNSDKAIESYIKKAEELALKAQEEWGKTGVAAYAKPKTSGGKKEEQLKSLQDFSDEALKIQKNRIDAELAAEKEYTAEWERLQRERIKIQQEMDIRSAKATEKKTLEDLDKSEKGGEVSREEAEKKRLEIIRDTQAQIEAINKKADADDTEIVNKRIEWEKETSNKAIQARIDYLKAYGNAAEKKVAIEEEAARKIAEIRASSDSEESKHYQIESVQKGAEQSKRSIDEANLKGQIDFAALFQGTKLMGEIATATIANVEQYMKSDTFKNSSVEDQKSIIEARNNLMAKTEEQGGLVGTYDAWKKAVEDMETYGKTVRDLTATQEKQRTALETAKIAYENVQKDTTATDEEKNNITQAYEAAQTAVDETGRALNEASANYINAQNRAANASDSFASKMSGITSGFKELASADGLTGLSQGVGKLMGAFGAKDKEGNAVTDATQVMGKAGGWIGAAFSIADLINDVGLEGIIDNLTETISGAVSGIMESFMSADFWTGMGESVLSSIVAPFEAFAQGNMKDLQKKIDDLKESNDALRMSIDLQREDFNKTTTVDAVDKYKQLEKDINQTNANTREMMLYTSQQYSGGRHSLGYKINNDSAFGKVKESINRVLGTSYKSVGDMLSNMTAEQWKEVQKQAPEAYMKLQSLIDKYKDDNHRGSGLKELLEEYIGLADELPELKKQLDETFMGISFDSMYDNFKSTLRDMSSTAADFADGIQKTFNDALIGIIADEGKEELEEIFKEMAKALRNKDFGRLYALKDQYDALAEKKIQQRKELEDRGVLNKSVYSQESSKKGFATASQDSIDELNGRFTAVQISGEEISAQMVFVIEHLDGITNIVTATNGHVAEIRNMMIMTNSYLEDMVKYAKLTYNNFGDHLEAIRNKVNLM